MAGCALFKVHSGEQAWKAMTGCEDLSI